MPLVYGSHTLVGKRLMLLQLEGPRSEFAAPCMTGGRHHPNSDEKVAPTVQVTDQPPRPVTPAPAAIYPDCDCGQEATPGHVCRPPQPQPEPSAAGGVA